MKPLRLSDSTPPELRDVIRRIHLTYHKRNCYPARSDVHNLVIEARDFIQNEDTEREIARMA